MTLRTLSEWKVVGETCPVKFAIGCEKRREFPGEVLMVFDDEWTSMDGDGARCRCEVADTMGVWNKEALMKAAPSRYIVVRRTIEHGMLPSHGVREDESDSLNHKCIYPVLQDV